MPEILRNLLRNVSDEQAEKLWSWLDGDPDAIHDMIEHLVNTHPVLQAKCADVDGEKA